MAAIQQQAERGRFRKIETGERKHSQEDIITQHASYDRHSNSYHFSNLMKHETSPMDHQLTELHALVRKKTTDFKGYDISLTARFVRASLRREVVKIVGSLKFG